VSPGDTPIILDIDRAGRIRRGWDTRLTGNHMLAFAVDARGGRLYALGSCLYKSGFSVVDLRDGGVPTPAATPGEWQWLATPEPPQVLQPTPCGERLALGPDSLAVVAGQGEVRLLDVATGQVIRDVSTSAMPLDVPVATTP
jgi:hypothetical protein